MELKLCVAVRDCIACRIIFR